MERMRTIAMYLPQFHEVPENNEWWGKGFTEWVAVKNAERLFEGHNQPREPWNDNYYDLLNRTTMEQQAQMAKEYGLDGFCFYHYYFKDGRKILEKPAENLLQWTDIYMPFCFCWANESWGRTWSQMEHRTAYVNSWVEKFEHSTSGEKKESGLLLEQKYGREPEWEEHFNYLLPFLKDRRYIKREGSPVFLIYKPGDIPCLAEMIHFWKEKMKANGFNGLYVVGLNTMKKLEGLDAVLINGPAMYFSQDTVGDKIKPVERQGVKGYRYEEVWENAIDFEPVKECRTYFGGFTDFDDTPRRGRNGRVLEGTSPKLFEKYLYLLMRKNQAEGNEYTFINAFNEWGEGMYLEPDKKNGYAYLEILRRVKEQINSMEENIPELAKRMQKKVSVESFDTRLQDRVDRLKLHVNIMDSWMSLWEQKKSVADFLEKYHYKKVAVYGIGILGKHLTFELLQKNIEVAYTIDRNKLLSYPGIPNYLLKEALPVVDAVIVTAVYEFDDIWKNIRNCKVKCPVLSLVELLNEV